MTVLAWLLPLSVSELTLSTASSLAALSRVWERCRSCRRKFLVVEPIFTVLPAQT